MEHNSMEVLHRLGLNVLYYIYGSNYYMTITQILFSITLIQNKMLETRVMFKISTWMTSNMA